MGLNQRFKQKMRQLEASINPSIKKAVNDNANILEDAQTEQFDRGKDALNVSFVPSYADFTITYKLANNQPVNRVTLKDSGDLYRNLTVKGTATQIVIEANTPDYFGDLVARYGSNQILGIQPKAMEEFMDDYIRTEIVKNFNIIISK